MYELRLAPDKKFSAQAARECLKDVLMTEFDDKIYDSSQIAKWTKETSQRICERLQGWLAAAFGIPTLTSVFQSSIMETACSVLLLSLPHITTRLGQRVRHFELADVVLALQKESHSTP
ncbi:uncharacterized protein LOC119441821 isoform X1 [Dermacentor silvarum]|uniref:uncharacterized protein LOC119441821 isoform X1 n=1 Tax=Dermacentor silvarum TaxID=543639 RepID=UPI00210144CB|nr:uncharacterized protein LOC119441821 isoform X1 [Dermacentor silvarum]